VCSDVTLLIVCSFDDAVNRCKYITVIEEEVEHGDYAPVLGSVPVGTEEYRYKNSVTTMTEGRIVLRTSQHNALCTSSTALCEGSVGSIQYKMDR
jgi:hypothetical protein